MHEEVSDEAARLLMLSPVEAEASRTSRRRRTFEKTFEKKRTSVSAAFGARESKGEGTGRSDGPRDRAASFARHPGRRVHPRAGGRADAHGPPRGGRGDRRDGPRAPPMEPPPPPPTPSGSCAIIAAAPAHSENKPAKGVPGASPRRVRRSRRMRRRADAPPRRRARRDRRGGPRHRRGARRRRRGESRRAPPPRRPPFRRLSGAPGWRSTRTSRSPRCRSRCPATRRTTRSCSTPPEGGRCVSRSRWRRGWPPRARPRQASRPGRLPVHTMMSEFRRRRAAERRGALEAPRAVRDGARGDPEPHRRDEPRDDGGAIVRKRRCFGNARRRGGRGGDFASRGDGEGALFRDAPSRFDRRSDRRAHRGGRPEGDAWRVRARFPGGRRVRRS